MTAAASVRSTSSLWSGRVPEQLLDRVLREIRERLDESRSAYEESQRLEAALAVLGSRALDTGHTDGRRPQTRTRRASGRAGSRAPRGENQRRIRAAIDERP